MTTGWALSLISGGQEYALSDNVQSFLLSADGLGGAPITQLTEQGPQQHGSSVVGFRLQPRKLVLVILYKVASDEWASRRDELIGMFAAAGEMMHLRFVSGDIIRQIDCYPSGIVELPLDGDLIPRGQRVIVELFCPDPTWYDPNGVAISFALGGGPDVLTVPLVIPMRVGASTIDTTYIIQYSGNWKAFPVITARGPLTNLVITNETTGDKLDFTGTTINVGDTYIIDCRYGRKTVTRTSDGTNRVRDLTSTSNLATFAVEPHPRVPDGVNSIRVRGTNLTMGSVIYFQFYPRYMGV